jgi:hypothetical protein
VAEFVRGRGRRPTAWYGVGSLLVVAGVALGGLLVVDWLTLSIEVDEDAMRTTSEHLDEVGSMLDSLPAYAGTEAGPALRLDCGADSGDLFQPGVMRTWSVLPGTEPEPVVAAIAEELTAAGWTVPATSNRVGDREPVTFDADEGWGAGGSLFSTYDGEAVIVEVRIRDARPCRLV